MGEKKMMGRDEFFAALEAGFYIARRGFLALSIEITDDDVDAFVTIVDGWAAGVRDLRGSACA